MEWTWSILIAGWRIRKARKLANGSISQNRYTQSILSALPGRETLKQTTDGAPEDRICGYAG